MPKRCPVTVAVTIAVALAAGSVVAGRSQGRAQDALAQTFDEILDLNVRDGFVYYRALKAQRGRLDSYINSLGAASIDSASQNEQAAFWLNAYDALVLQTVIDHYPIAQRSREYPARSIRQIPGAFERLTHRVAGRTVTLDQIEQTILSAFHDPRLNLVLGRGAVGSGRLRSEVYTADRLEEQLAQAASECLNHAQCVTVDRAANKLRISSIFSWRQADFIAAFSDKAPDLFKTRSPIERAALAFIGPKLLTTERDFIDKNEFAVEFIPFDWTLNDLTGR